jgi:hypothetical protein
MSTSPLPFAECLQCPEMGRAGGGAKFAGGVLNQDRFRGRKNFCNTRGHDLAHLIWR